MVDWKCISTAPKDGTEFQAWGTWNGKPFWFTRVKWNDKEDMFQIWDSWDYDDYGSFGPWNKKDLEFHDLNMTHWDEIPLGPKGEPNNVRL